MHVIDDGPNLPNSVLEAQEEGTLAFICGAGISVPNGLPSFRNLVKQVQSHFGAQHTKEVNNLVKDGDYDRALNYLAHDYGDTRVRRKVQDILTRPCKLDTPTHQALLDLGTSQDGHLQVVTTNFDLLFEKAANASRYQTAPTLPVPKPNKWDGLVYLHGRISENDPDGQHLVLTSSDFGTAYLTERWASRFVTDLFAHFTVVFVGYSVSDPVMRYLVDAIAADRARGGHAGVLSGYV